MKLCEEFGLGSSTKKRKRTQTPPTTTLYDDVWEEVRDTMARRGGPSEGARQKKVTGAVFSPADAYTKFNGAKRRKLCLLTKTDHSTTAVWECANDLYTTSGKDSLWFTRFSEAAAGPGHHQPRVAPLFTKAYPTTVCWRRETYLEKLCDDEDLQTACFATRTG